jgi:hypothetical protein
VLLNSRDARDRTALFLTSISPVCHREEPLCRIGRSISAEFGTSVILSGLAEDDRSALLQRFVAQVEATLRPSRETSTT